MKSSIFVVEGQTEQIFLMNFIEQLASLKEYHLVMTKYHNQQIFKISTRGCAKDESSHLIEIINVENDDKVLSYISENIKRFVEKGFQSVFGLRDRYTGDKNKTKINPDSVDEITAQLQEEHKVFVEISIAIEELEAWFLSVPDFFENYDKSLSLDHIRNGLGIKLDPDNVELIEHPATLIHEILSRVGKEYKKKLGDSYKITQSLNYSALYLEKSAQISSLARTIKHLETALS